MISVLLPTFNQAAFLPAALAGLAEQTRRDFELIACDDGSTDGTADILREHARTNATGNQSVSTTRNCGTGTASVAGRSRITILTHGRNEGTAAAINSAAAVAGFDSRYLTWVSSDNVMHVDWLATLAGELDDRPDLGAVYSAFNWCDGERTREVRQGPYDPARLIGSEDCYFGPSFLIRREVWQPHRGNISHDYDNWARVEEACWARGLGIGYIDRPLCDYRVHDGRASVRQRHLFDAPRWRAEAIRRRGTTL